MKSLLATLVLIPFLTFSQLPKSKFGQGRTLEVSTWNIEFFGSTTNGPSDEDLQLSKAKANIEFLNFDIIALQEICDDDHFEELVSQLTSYKGIRSKKNSDYQETAILWNPDAVELKSNKRILTNKSYHFASRPPHQFLFSDKTGVLNEDFYVIVVHLKAHRGSPQDKKRSYEMRTKASELLEGYIDNDLDDKNVIIIGDWNDDVDVSNYNKEKTPFSNLISSDKYDFATWHLSWGGSASSKYGSVIDHICLSDELYSRPYMSGIANLPTYDRDFIKKVSDHFPTYVIFH